MERYRLKTAYRPYSACESTCTPRTPFCIKNSKVLIQAYHTGIVLSFVANILILSPCGCKRVQELLYDRRDNLKYSWKGGETVALYAAYAFLPWLSGFEAE